MNPVSRAVAARVRWAALGVALAAAASNAGCAYSQKIRSQLSIAQEDVDKARKSGAYRCAPRELALAEANVEFTEGELDQGNWSRAEKHLDVALAQARLALKNSAGCAPKEVIVKAAPPPPPVEAPPPPPTIVSLDRDRDTVPDATDKCPDVPGLPELAGCPEPKDTDGDGLVDEIDKCPADPEDFDGDQDDDGCPDVVYDRDQDGLLDDRDRCPEQPEDVDGFQDEDGCPELDNDSDTIMDVDDRCPLDPGVFEHQGCPPPPPPAYKLVVVNRESKKIEIKQKVQFATGKAKIESASYGLLDEVAQALRDNPGLEVLIEGHTDNVGSDSTNLKLSDARAHAVLDYLADEGEVARGRMKAMGFGKTRPIASNNTASGREANRRVEFTITKQGD